MCSKCQPIVRQCETELHNTVKHHHLLFTSDNSQISVTLSQMMTTSFPLDLIS